MARVRSGQACHIVIQPCDGTVSMPEYFCAAHLGSAPCEGGDDGDGNADALARGDTGPVDQARAKVGWDRDVPDGARLHVSGFSDDGLHVTDVWESEQAFNEFMEHRLAPVIQELGIPGQPEVKFFPLHGLFAPALGQSEQVSDL